MNVGHYILIAGLRLYQWVISPAKAVLFGPMGRCRYSPSCSAYAVEAIREHGTVAGMWLTTKRLGRCHPWGGCGWDPVPGKLQSCGCSSAADPSSGRGA